MSALSRDEPVVLELVPPEDLVGLTEDEAYALLAGIGPQTSTAKMPVAAAGNPQPSASVAAEIEG